VSSLLKNTNHNLLKTKKNYTNHYFAEKFCSYSLGLVISWLVISWLWTWYNGKGLFSEYKNFITLFKKCI